MTPSTSHTTALALQRLVEGLADVNQAVKTSTTVDELFTLWSQFAPLMATGLAVQDSLGLRVEALLAQGREVTHAEYQRRVSKQLPESLRPRGA